MYVGARGNTPITVAVVHTNEGPEAAHGAQNLLDNVLLRNGPNGGGYHAITDQSTLVRAARDDQVVYGAPYVNHNGLHLCHVGYAAQSREQWLDAYSRGELNLSAAQFAQWAKDHGLPVRRLTEDQLRNGEKGFCGHIDVTNAFKERGLLERPPIHLDHTDPGLYFPWDVFLPLVNLALNGPGPLPPVPPTPEAILTTIALEYQGNPGVAKPVPALGGVLLTDGARVEGDTPVKGSPNHFWRHTAVPVNGKLDDIVDLRPAENAIAALYDLGDGQLHGYRARILSSDTTK